VLFHQRIEKRARDSKRRSPKAFDRLRKVDQAALGCQVENPKRASYTESLGASYNYALPIVHEQQIGLEQDGQGDRGRLAFIESLEGRLAGSTAWRFVDEKPHRRISNPIPYGRRSAQVSQLRSNGGWQDNFIKQDRQEIDLTDQYQVIYRPGI